MIYFVLLCTFIQYSNTQPLFNVINDDNDDPTQAYDDMLNNYISQSNRLNIPENLYNYYQQQQLVHQNKQYHPDNLHLAKRIIMLPRVGRRSIRSTSV